MHKNCYYPLRGVAGCIQHNTTGACRIVVPIGEIESTNNLDVQNLTYGIGSLFHEDASSPIVCITVLNPGTGKAKRTCTARNPTRADIVGAVQLKYYISPSPINLTDDMETLHTALLF